MAMARRPWLLLLLFLLPLTWAEDSEVPNNVSNNISEESNKSSEEAVADVTDVSDKSEAASATVNAVVEDIEVSAEPAQPSGPGTILFVLLLMVMSAATLAAFRQRLLLLSGPVRRKLCTRIYGKPAPNEQISQPYGSLLELMLAISTEVALDPATVLNLLLGVVEIWIPTRAGTFTGIRKLNLTASLVNLLAVAVREIGVYNATAALDYAANEVEVEYRSQTIYRRKPAKLLAQGESLLVPRRGLDAVALPAKLRLSGCKPQEALLNMKRHVGEDRSTVVKARQTAEEGLLLSTPDTIIMGEVLDMRGGEKTEVARHVGKTKQCLPDYADVSLGCLNLLAAVSLCGLAYLGAFVGLKKLAGQPSADSICTAGLEALYTWPSEAEPSEFERDLALGLVSALLILSGLLPLMRFPVAFHAFVQTIEWIFAPGVVKSGLWVRNYSAVLKLEKLRVLYADKTGTLAAPSLAVREISQCMPGLSRIASRLGVAEETLIAGILLACNDTQMVNGVLDGTSVEEVEVVRHLLNGPRSKIASFDLLKNPLEPGPKAELSFQAMGDDPKIEVVKRSQFCSKEQCRSAELRWSKRKLTVRQGVPATLAKRAKYAEEEALASKNPGRGLGYVVSLDDEPEIYALRLTFESLLQPGSSQLCSGSRSMGVAVRILTGDSEEAAMHAAQELGLGGGGRTEKLPPTKGAEGMDEALKRAEGASCVVARGEVLSHILSVALWRERVAPWLTDGGIDMVVYDASLQDKADIVRATSSMLDGQGTCATLGSGRSDVPADVSDAVRLCMAHGTPQGISCADVILGQPNDVFRVLHDYRPLLLRGLDFLLRDISFISGFGAGAAFIGIANCGVARLPPGLVQEDDWSLTRLHLGSSVQLLFVLFHPLSFVLCAVGGAASKILVPSDAQPQLSPVWAAISLVIGLVMGCLLGAFGPRGDAAHLWDEWVICCLWMACILRHAVWLPVSARCRPAAAARGIHILAILALSVDYQDALKATLEGVMR